MTSFRDIQKHWPLDQWPGGSRAGIFPPMLEAGSNRDLIIRGALYDASLTDPECDRYDSSRWILYVEKSEDDAFEDLDGLYWSMVEKIHAAAGWGPCR